VVSIRDVNKSNSRYLFLFQLSETHETLQVVLMDELAPTHRDVAEIVEPAAMVRILFQPKKSETNLTVG
jgi:transposase